MKTLKDRLSASRKEKKLSQSELAKLAKVSQSAIAAIETGRNQSTTYLPQIAAALMIDPLWLATGRSSNAKPESNAAMTGNMEESNTAPSHSTIAAIEDQEDLSAYEHIELYDVKLSAGNGTTTWIAREDEPLLFRKAWLKKRGFSSECCKGMYVRGDSMTPALEDWDTVLIDTSDTELVTGEIYAVAYKGKTFIKEVRVRPDSVELVSINTKYEPIIIPDNEADQLQVLGRKVWRGG